MKKRIAAMALAYAMVMGTAALAAGGAKSISVTPMNMTVNGQTVTPTKSNGEAAEVFAYDGATYVPLRYLSELLGIQVDWDKNSPNTAKLVGDNLKLPVQGGIYTASAAGRNGDVTLTVTISDGKITDIQFESVETETIGVAAMEALTEQVLDNQSLGMDMISGATLTCQAYLTALEDCVKQAGLDVEALRDRTVAGAGAVDYVTRADVIVVGAGGAGLSAAVTAAQSGASVILLEKSGMVGGNTLCATMGINAAGSKVQKEAGVSVTVEDFVAQQMNNDDAREDLVRALCEHSGETIDWFSNMGVKFEVGGNSDFMLMAAADGKTSTTMVNAVYKALRNSDVNLYLNTEVTGLTTSDGVVTGCVAADADGKEITFSGKAVILCTGGFGQNRELMAQYRPDLATAITDEIAPTTGQGLEMALKLGADTVNMDAIQLFPHVIVGYGLLTPNNIPGGFGVDAIYVNNAAQRFAAEGFEISEAILSQPDGMAYCVFNESNLNDTLKSLVNNGFIVSGSTPAELAEKLGLDPDALSATIEKWNTDCAAGVDSQFGKDKNLNPLGGTLYGYNFGVGAHYFMGGILINKDTQVLKTDGSPISGLYAAGEVTGGFHGNYRVDGCGTADAFVFGRIAGANAAKAK